MDTPDRYAVSVWPGSPTPDHSVGRALVLPGGGYTVDQPLLLWACHVLAQLDWRVVTMRWQWTEQDDPRTFVEAGAEKLDLEAGPAATTLLVAKSLGSYAAGWAAARRYPAVWLTPVLTDDFVAEALGRHSAPALLVGGTSDRLWDAERASDTGLSRLEIHGADHSLQVSDDWRASIEALQQTLTAVEDFATTVASRG
ncbi:MAG: alpha/beta hydrolase [Propionibacteriaceae bacterium]